MLLRIFRIAFAVWLAVALAQPPLAQASAEPALSRSDVQRLAHRIIAGNKDPDGWGKDIWDALSNNGIATRHGNVCAVMAVIEQESTFTANPRVKGLGALAEREIEDKLSQIPMLPQAAAQGVKWFLANRPTPAKSYLKLIRAARSERDLDLVFRNMTFSLFPVPRICLDCLPQCAAGGAPRRCGEPCQHTRFHAGFGALRAR